MDTKKYLNYISGIANGTINEPWEVYLNPEIKDKKWYQKYLKQRESNVKFFIDLNQGDK